MPVCCSAMEARLMCHSLSKNLTSYDGSVFATEIYWVQKHTTKIIYTFFNRFSNNEGKLKLYTN